MPAPLMYRDQYEARDASKGISGTRCTKEEDKTRQQDKDSADINITIRKYNLQPLDMVPGWSGKVGMYGDVTGVPSMQEAMGRIAVAAETFSHVPPEIRVLYNNDVAEMLDAWDNGRDEEVFLKLGWIEKRVEPAAGAVPPIVPAPSSGGGS
ncbi:MAG: internal scaffolding protein [Microviridae sp.]|nr:MAG: internal scaffolding protein [Microviridae sp.]